jgi:hypothetical protein
MSPTALSRVINMQTVEVDFEVRKQLQLLYAHTNGMRADANQHKHHCS